MAEKMAEWQKKWQNGRNIKKLNRMNKLAIKLNKYQLKFILIFI